MTDPIIPRRIVLCGGGDCRECGMKRILQAFETSLAEHELSNTVEIRISKCQDRCKVAPNATLMPGATQYARLTPKGARRIVEQHLQSGEPVADLLYKKKKKLKHLRLLTSKTTKKKKAKQQAHDTDFVEEMPKQQAKKKKKKTKKHAASLAAGGLATSML